VITFRTNPAGHPVTESGRPVTCDGCGIRLTTQPGEAQQTLVPAFIAREVYGRQTPPPAGVEPLTYVVCERGVDCFALALLADELYQRARCKDPLCDGDGVRPCRWQPAAQ
jgi:hypothetical protein